MSLNDPLANVLSRILAADRRGLREVTMKENSKIIRRVLELLNEAGYLGATEEIADSRGSLIKVNLLGKINKCGVVKPRYAIAKDEYERFEKRYLPARDFGVIVISTNEGMMLHSQAKEKLIGGKLMCYCY